MFLVGRKAAAGAAVFFSSRPAGALARARSVQLGLKSSRHFSSAAHFLTLERCAMEASTPLDGLVSSRPAGALARYPQRAAQAKALAPLLVCGAFSYAGTQRNGSIHTPCRGCFWGSPQRAALAKPGVHSLVCGAFPYAGTRRNGSIHTA